MTSFNICNGHKGFKDSSSLAALIDQTLLEATATKAQVEAFCAKAASLNFASVCINPAYVPLAAKLLKDSSVRVCTVIDFPLGAGGLDCKKAQAEAAVKLGALELDFVISIGLVKAADWQQLKDELCELNSFAKDISSSLWQKQGSIKSREGISCAVTKLILETCLLEESEIRESCRLAVEAGFDFVKTSTGFAIIKGSDGAFLPNGATTSAVRLMRECVGTRAGVKASGGIRSAKDALAMLESGASRLGTSSGVKILQEFETLKE